MAKSSSTGARRRYGASAVTKALQSLTWLLIIIIGLTGLNWIAVAFQGGTWLPKLALDLEGGTQIVLEAQLPEGAGEPSGEEMAQAVAIIRQRIDAAGVSEAEITRQGSRNIVVSVPGEMDEQTRARIENSAKLEFRPVLVSDQAANIQDMPAELLEMQGLPAEPPAAPTSPSDTAYITAQLASDFLALDCAASSLPTGATDPTQPLVTCDATGTEKFILGPVEASGADITDASNGLARTQTGATTGQWVVNIELNETGATAFATMSQRLYGMQGAQNRFAATLDNLVITAPTMNAIITDGKAQISGQFTEQSSKALADQLKFGALPFNFQTQSDTTISATLGTSQLVSGLIAGLIGLALVVIYSIFQYRVLGLVTIASLVISAVVAYLAVTILSNLEGYRLSLAGVAGLIVAIGITADSFIVYFERIKDELRDGRSLPAAVEAGWGRAIRTILASDAVNFLVAVVLFFIAVGNVRGFALTLGLTTLIDLLVVTMFTHPLMRLLAKTRFFGGGHPASGLDPRALGAVYRGRGTFRVSTDERRRGAAREAEKRQSLAERKADGSTADARDRVDDDELETTSAKRRARRRASVRAGAAAAAGAATAVATSERDDDAVDVEDDDLDGPADVVDDAPADDERGDAGDPDADDPDAGATDADAVPDTDATEADPDTEPDASAADASDDPSTDEADDADADEQPARAGRAKRATAKRAEEPRRMTLAERRRAAEKAAADPKGAETDGDDD